MSNQYQKIIAALKRRKKGATAADVCAATALPLATVNDYLPKAADEYSGHLRVTASGEILYYFPDGFTSRYKGLGVFVRKAVNKISAFIKTASVFLFKIWIVIMLIGYFIIFLALAIGSVFLSVAAQSNNRNGRRNTSVNFGLFNILWRIWFYSELTRPRYNYERNYKMNDIKKRPMHKAVFSFVFGEDDPNKDWDDRQYKAVITYIQAKKGVISLAEYMAFTGMNSLEAETSILSFCSKFEGSPEVTEEGTIVYRFDKLLLRADSVKFGELDPPIKRLKKFSDNTKTMNGWFAVINTVNLLFGSYFLYQSNAEQLITDIQSKNVTLYAYTHYFLSQMTNDPYIFIWAVLGLIPLLFSVLFWVIPIIRYFKERKENNEIKLENFKRLSFSKIYSSPNNIDINIFSSSIPECSPPNFESSADRVIKDMGAVFNPQIEVSQDGKTKYLFTDLETEKRALENYRNTIDTSRQKLGETVFDSNS